MQYLPFLISGIYLIFKALNNAIRISDTNVYFYTAYQLWQGKILYKDVFFTNFPLFPYISVVYSFLLGYRLELYYFTVVIEVVIISILLYKIISHETKNKLVGLFCQLFYLSSHIVITTSDRQTGVFLASLFSVVGYYFFKKQRIVLSGILFGLMVMIKAYYFPIVLGVIFYLFIQKKKAIFSFIGSVLITMGTVLLPALLTAPNDFFRQVVQYSAFRAAGINKLNMYLYFITHDILLFILLLSACFHVIKKNILSFIIIISLIFVLCMKSIYYLYLNLLVPFLILEIGTLYQYYHGYIRRFLSIVLVLSMLLIAGSFIRYLVYFSLLNKIGDIQTIIATIKSVSPKVIYGAEEIVTAFAYLSKTPMLNGLVDTNDGLFRKGLLNAKKLTQDAIDKQAVIVVRGFDYPEKHIKARVVGQSVDRELLLSRCLPILSIPIQTSELSNRVNIYSCK